MAMTEDWSIDVRKYVPNADSGVIAAIVRYCGIALQSRDSSLVSFSDDVEIGRVRENFLKKKLGLTNPDSELNAAIAAVGQRMKGDRTKNRVTVYYLLAEHFRKLSIFGGDDAVRATSTPRAFAAEEAGVAAAATAGVVGLGDRIAERERPATPAYAARSSAAAAPAASGGASRWLPWLLGLAALLAIGWFLLSQRQAARPVATVAPAVTPAPAPRVATAPAAAPAVIAPAPAVTPAAPAAIVGLPAKVHFALGSSVLSADERVAITTAAEAITRDSLRVAVTGYTDRTGNLAANEALAQRRATAVRDALIAGGVPASSIEMRAPGAVENGPSGAPDLEARRVEINRL